MKIMLNLILESGGKLWVWEESSAFFYRKATKINGWWSQISFSFGWHSLLLTGMTGVVKHNSTGIFKRKWKKAEKRKRFFWVSQILVKLYHHTAPFQFTKKNNVHIKEKHSNNLIGRDSDTKINWHNTESPWLLGPPQY